MDRTALKRACSSTERFVANLTAEDLELPTPCSAWQVRALLSHLLGVLSLHRALMSDTTPLVHMQPGGLPDADLVAGDAFGAYRAGAEGVLATTDDDALARPHQTPLGEMPGAVLCGFSTLDILVHGWDLAVATGRDATLESDLAEQLLAFARQMISDDVRAPQIGPAVIVDPSASPTDRLVAFMGRTPVPSAPSAPSAP